VGAPISTIHVGKGSAEPLMGGVSCSPPSLISPFLARRFQLSQLGGAGGRDSPQNAQILGEDAKRLLQKTGDAVSKPLSALGRIPSEVSGNAERCRRRYGTPLHQTGIRKHGHCLFCRLFDAYAYLWLLISHYIIQVQIVILEGSKWQRISENKIK